MSINRLLNRSFRGPAENGIISSGIEALDSITNQGIDRGFITQFYGSSITGKTAIAYQYIKNADYTLLIDSNNSFDHVKAVKFNIPLNKVIYVNTPDPDIIIELVRQYSNLIDLIIIDDYASINSDDHRSYNSLLQSIVSGTSTALILINQIRNNRSEEVPYARSSKPIESLIIYFQPYGVLKRSYKRVGRRIKVTTKYSNKYSVNKCLLIDIFFDGTVIPSKIKDSPVE
jgi:hypothetical protein